MKRLWRRLMCWMSDVCPEHGPMRYVGTSYADCLACDTRRYEDKRQREAAEKEAQRARLQAIYEAYCEVR